MQDDDDDDNWLVPQESLNDEDDLPRANWHPGAPILTARNATVTDG